ncbi:MFS transporter [Arthrobacter sp. UYCu712]|uniref:MFS transporter n=1 Tax=Arthrobacter sp. UYCu712 TaxID=3156340 RepID=UPI0033979337
MTATGYREFTAARFLLWAAVALSSKLPVAMAPLALVFLVRDTGGGYAFGAILAGVYVAGEVVGAPVLGRRYSQNNSKREISAGLAIGALAFAAITWTATAAAWLPILLAFLAGAAPAASTGAVRMMLTTQTTEANVPRALSLETTLTQITWAASPAAVVTLASHASSVIPLWVGAAFALASAVLVMIVPLKNTVPEPYPEAQPTHAEGTTLSAGWPIYLASAAAMVMLSSAELVLPALLEFRGIDVGWAGPLLTGFAVFSAIGAVIYGLRKWPGKPETQSHVFLLITAASFGTGLIWHEVAPIAVALAIGGLFQSGVLVTRNLSLRKLLPPQLHAAGYSVMYAVQGVGYGLAASMSSVLMIATNPVVAFAVAIGLAVVLTALSVYGEKRTKKMWRMLPIPGAEFSSQVR